MKSGIIYHRSQADQAFKEIREIFGGRLKLFFIGIGIVTLLDDILIYKYIKLISLFTKKAPHQYHQKYEYDNNIDFISEI